MSSTIHFKLIIMLIVILVGFALTIVLIFSIPAFYDISLAVDYSYYAAIRVQSVMLLLPVIAIIDLFITSYCLSKPNTPLFPLIRTFWPGKGEMFCIVRIPDNCFLYLSACVPLQQYIVEVTGVEPVSKQLYNDLTVNIFPRWMVRTLHHSCTVVSNIR